MADRNHVPGFDPLTCKSHHAHEAAKRSAVQLSKSLDGPTSRRTLADAHRWAGTVLACTEEAMTRLDEELKGRRK